MAKEADTSIATDSPSNLRENRNGPPALESAVDSGREDHNEVNLSASQNPNMSDTVRNSQRRNQLPSATRLCKNSSDTCQPMVR